MTSTARLTHRHRAATCAGLVAALVGSSILGIGPARPAPSYHPTTVDDADVVILKRKHRPAAEAARVFSASATPGPREGEPADGGAYVQVIDQDLRSVIAEFARQERLTAQIGSDVRQRVVNTRIPLDRAGFLQTLQRRFGVAAYVDGDTLVAAGKTGVVTRLVPLGDVKAGDVEAELRNAGIPLDSHGVKYLPDSGSLMVTAPGPIVARVAGIVDAVRAKSDHDAVRVLRFGQEGR